MQCVSVLMHVKMIYINQHLRTVFKNQFYSNVVCHTGGKTEEIHKVAFIYYTYYLFDML